MIVEWRLMIFEVGSDRTVNFNIKNRPRLAFYPGRLPILGPFAYPGIPRYGHTFFTPATSPCTSPR